MEKIQCLSFIVDKRMTYYGRWFEYYIIYTYTLEKNRSYTDEATTIKKLHKLINLHAKELEIPFILTSEQVKSHFIPTFIDILDLTEVFK